MKWLAPAHAAELASEGTTAFRVASGDDQWIECFGESVLLSLKDPALAGERVRELDRWLGDAGIPISRVFIRHLVRQPREKDRPALWRGDPGEPASGVVRENGLRYEVNFDAGYSVGLFCDQRANRRFLQSLAPARVLNTFAYTCAFSVAAAARGAETLSVDLSKSSLARGRRNFELNHIAPANHRFLADDVLSVLPRLIQRGATYDAIILDPPTFGRSSPRRAFRAERDYEGLVAMALGCAAPGAWILLSTNCSSLSVAKLRAMASRVARGKASFHQEPPEPDFPPGHGAATIWMRWEGRQPPTKVRPG